MLAITILSSIFAVAATVCAFIFIVPSKKRAQLNGIGKFLHDLVNFKYLIIEKILQALYILATAFVIFYGFFMLFYVVPGYEGYYYSSPAVWYGGYGLLAIIVGPIAVRVAYEFLMMAVLLVKNVIQLNNKVKGDDNTADVFDIPKVETAAPAAEPVEVEAPVAEATPEVPTAE